MNESNNTTAECACMFFQALQLPHYYHLDHHMHQPDSTVDNVIALTLLHSILLVNNFNRLQRTY
jgi:hypothetical protein